LCNSKSSLVAAEAGAAGVVAADVAVEVLAAGVAACVPVVDFRRRAECRGLLVRAWERGRVPVMAVALVLVAVQLPLLGRAVVRRPVLGLVVCRVVVSAKAARGRAVDYQAALGLALVHALALAESAIWPAVGRQRAN
jgi:hypothetical protein